jgi:hypothetical protein
VFVASGAVLHQEAMPAVGRLLAEVGVEGVAIAAGRLLLQADPPPPGTEPDPVREIAKNIDAEHRPQWLSWSFDHVGLTSWVDEHLCSVLGVGCPPLPFYDSTWGQVYFYMLICANLFVIMLLISVVGGLVSHLLDPMPRTLRERREELNQLGVTVLVPCYLPNEHEIIWSTLAHIVENIEYEFAFEVIVCYNTPHEMAIEEQLARVDGRKCAHPCLAPPPPTLAC